MPDGSSTPSQIRFDLQQDGAPVHGHLLVAPGEAALTVVAAGSSLIGTGRTITGSLGTLSITPDGWLAYVPDRAMRLPEGASEEDVFSLTVADGDGAQATLMLVMTVIGINDPALISGQNSGAISTSR